MGKTEIAVDVLCVGHASFDVTLQLAHHPGGDEKCFAENRIECGGGPAANAAVTVARLGGQSAFAGYLGNDLHGQMHFRELCDENVGTGLLVRGGNPTPLSVILVKPGGDRTVINHKKQTPPLAENGIDFSACRPKVILFDGHEPFISLPLAQYAKESGIPTVLDAGSVHRGTTELAPLVDYLIASVKFAADFSGKKDTQAALQVLNQLAPVVIITLGKEGLIWGNREERGALPAFPVEVVDTTGAGDAFHGVFALGIARSKEFRDNLRFSSAVAALACTKLGARTALPQLAEVEHFLFTVSD